MSTVVIDTYRQLKWSDVEAGHQVPRVTLSMNFSRVLISAILTIDYFTGHHDVEFARRQGRKSIYVNTVTYCGFIDRTVTDWAGPETFIVRRSFSMSKPVCAGDEMYAEGRVAQVYLDDTGRRLVDIDLEVGTQAGVHFPAKVTVLLPA